MTQSLQIPDVLLTLGRVLDDQGVIDTEKFSITCLERGWLLVTIHTLDGVESEKCRNLTEVRNYIAYTAAMWIDDGSGFCFAKRDKAQIAELIELCWKLDLPEPTNKKRTGKGISTAGIISIAESKGIEIRHHRGYTYVVFPGELREYKYHSSLLATAKKLGIISESEANERYSNDDRHGMSYIDGRAVTKN
jgi:hypothetical protein